MLSIRILFAAIVLFLVSAAPVLAQSRGLTVELRTEEDAAAPVAESVELYDNSYALVIGNDAYAGGWPRLSNAVADAVEVASALKQAGFEVTLRQDLDSFTLRDTLREFFAIQGADPEARLLLWYAGHGHSIRDEGFLVPVDAPAPSEPQFKVRALQMRDFGSLMRLAEAKHVLAIFDSCFSGTIFTTRAGMVPAAITRVTTKPTRQFMTSGDANQQVSDDGTFRRLFLQALAGESTADHNRDGYLTGTELGLFLSDRLTSYSEGAQTPRYGKLRDPDFDQGDFVFALPGVDNGNYGGGPGRNASPGTDDLVAEINLWAAVKNSEDPSILQVYLDAFPTGRFAGEARDLVAEIDLWKNVARSEESGTVGKYLFKYPSGRYAMEARALVAEIDLWNTVFSSDEPDIVQKYLEKYPAGRFADAARDRIEVLLASIPPEPDPEPIVEPTRRWFLAVYDNLDFYGGDIYPKGIDKTSMEDCAQACADETRCNNFTFNLKADRCFLKEDFAYTVNFDGAQSGVFYRDSTGQSRPRFEVNWQVFRKYDMPGGDFQTLRVDSYEQCIAACNGDGSCLAFTYSPVSGRDYCFLKGANAGAPVPYTKTTVISGRRITSELQPSAIWPLERY